MVAWTMDMIEEVKTLTKVFLLDQDAKISHQMSLPRKDFQYRLQVWETIIFPRKNWAWSTRIEPITKSQVHGQIKVTLTEQLFLVLIPFTLREIALPLISKRIMPIESSLTKTEWYTTKDSITESMESFNKWINLHKVFFKQII